MMTFLYPDQTMVFTLTAEGKPSFLVTKNETLIRGAYWACPMWYVLGILLSKITTKDWSMFVTPKYLKLSENERENLEDMFAEACEGFFAEIVEKGFNH